MTSSTLQFIKTFREVSKIAGEPVVNIRKIKAVKGTKGGKSTGGKAQDQFEKSKALIADEIDDALL